MTGLARNQLTLVSDVIHVLAARGRGRGSCCPPPPQPRLEPLRATTTSKPPPPAPQRSVGAGRRPLNPARASAAQNAGLRILPDYKTHNAPGGGGGEGGGASRCLRPRHLPPGSARGSAMELAELGGESLRLGRTTPLPQQLALLAPPLDLPRPPATRGVGAGGGKMRRVVEDGGGEGKVLGSRERSGVLQQAGFGEVSQGRRGVGTPRVGFK